jgi:hypothetical protein
MHAKGPFEACGIGMPAKDFRLLASSYYSFGGIVMSENITISGQVRDYDQRPIQTIIVDVYRDAGLVGHGRTDGEGKYEVTVPRGAPITVRFDTNPTITNAREWHPSVVASIDAQHDIVLDRFLMRVGEGRSETAAIDALTAYQFCAFWTDIDLHQLYAEYAADRIQAMKLITPVLQDVQQKLVEHFRKQARSS